MRNALNLKVLYSVCVRFSFIMMTIIKTTICALSASLLFACGSVQTNRDTTTARAHAANDPLLDTIISTADGQPLEPAQLYDSMAGVQVVYLGEIHENQRHHELQLQALQTLLDLNIRPALGFEFFSVEQTGYLMNFVDNEAVHGKQADDEQAEKKLREKLNWGQRRDEEWSYYFPLLKLAKEYELKVFGTDLPDSLKRRISRSGVAGLTAVEKRLLHSTGFDDPVYRQYMEQTLVDAHCGWNDPTLIGNLYETWLQRNDTMAQSIAAMAKTGQAVLMIIGAGHTRHNLAVIERVNHILPGVRQFNLGYQELALEPQAADDYYQTQKIADRQLAPSHDYLWFTPRSSFEDPCDRFKIQLQKHKVDKSPDSGE